PPPPLPRPLPAALPILILFAPPAFVPQCQVLSRDSPSPLVGLSISTHFTATPRIPVPPPNLKQGSFQCHFRVEPGAFTSDFPHRSEEQTSELQSRANRA